MPIVDHTSQPLSGTPERNRYLARMAAKHPHGWALGGVSCARSGLSDEQVFAELNRLQDLADAGQLERHDSFPEPTAQRDASDLFV